MKLGLQLHPDRGVDAVIAEARRADEQGFDSVWLSDHLMNPMGQHTADGPLDYFVLMTALGAVTKRTLAGIGPTLFIGVIGLIVASVVNIFLVNDGISFIISVVGVVIFTALTAYDVKRITSGDYAAAAGSLEKAAVFSALALYLDFINIFLFLLRIMGSNRD